MILRTDDVEYYKRCRNIKKKLDKLPKKKCPEDIWYDRDQEVWVTLEENPCPDCDRDTKCAENDHKWSRDNHHLLVIKTEDLL